MATAELKVEGVQELSDEKGRAFFDSQAKRLLNMSGAEFLATYDAGKYPNPDDPAVMQLVMLIPFVRRWSAAVPGRSPHEAVRNFIEPLQRAFSCVTDAILFTPGGYFRAQCTS